MGNGTMEQRQTVSGTERLAEAMFNAYNEKSPNPWKTFDGRDVPRWPELGDQVQAKWMAAARKSAETLAAPGFTVPGLCVVFFCYDADGNLLLQRRSGKNCRSEPGRWDVGGGKIHFGETSHEALVREVQEEYGVVPLDATLLGTREAIWPGKTEHWVTLDYKVIVVREDVVIGEPDKVDALMWLEPGADHPSPMHEMLPDALERYKEKLNG